MDIAQRIHEIKMMWRQLDVFNVLDEHDSISGLTVHFRRQPFRFNTRREVHAFLTGLLEAIRWMRYEEEKDNDNED